jgi:NAD-dependent DNA ligase
VWKVRNPVTIDNFVIDDFVTTTGGVDVVSRTKFKEWAAAFMAKITSVRSEKVCVVVGVGEGLGAALAQRFASATGSR